tara:strand:+ start:337 stop:1017 length:681 start_codon:yes stop_codon:yes gene_type:complete
MDPEGPSFMERSGVYQLEVTYTSGWIHSLHDRERKRPITVDLVHDRKATCHAASKAQHVYEAKSLEIKNPIPLRMVSHITNMEIVQIEETRRELSRRTGKSISMKGSLHAFAGYLAIKRVKSESGIENFILEMFPYGINKDKEKEAENLTVYIDVKYDVHRDKGLEHDLLLKKENDSLKEKIKTLEERLAMEKKKTKKLVTIKAALQVLQSALLEDEGEREDEDFF